ncbi:MAG: glycosyltransferase, partial [Burkholderiales bacterium]|nr:glycosyltransferase [Burkholderiales bacterium]
MNKTNKVIIIVGSNSIHTQRFVQAICNHFDKIVFVTNEFSHTPLNAICHVANFKLNNVFAPKQIAKIIKTYLISETQLIIHIHQANSYAYHTIKAIKKFHIPAKTILTTWGSDILVLPNKNCLLKTMVKYNLANSDIITSDSLYMSSKIYELLNKDHDVRTINFGIKNFPTPVLSSSKDNLILSNRLHKPLYRIDKIITAFSKLITNNSDYQKYTLVMVAGGTESAKLRQIAQKLGLTDKQIIFTGMISYNELQNWYKKAKIFISVPESDATSLSVLEAMAYGCYPILSNIPANLEWVINQVNGSICQNLDKLDQEIKYAINQISIANTYEKLISFNHQLIAKKAQFEQNIQEFLQL